MARPIPTARLATMVLGFSLCSVPAGQAQGGVDALTAPVAQWMAMIERSFVPLAEAMPEEKYGFRPTEGAFDGVRTFGEQVKHVACGNFAFFNEIEKKAPPERCDTGGPSLPARRRSCSHTCGNRLPMPIVS